ncbi:MAG: hypothetical protein WC070_02610 [Candidatus Magasanikbacteria bacterium]
MKKNKLFNIIFTIVFFVFNFSVLSSVALSATPNCDTQGDLLGLECVGGNTDLSGQDPRIIIVRVINVILGLLGITVTVLMLYAGFLWMTAGGDDSKVEKARNIIFGSIIGLAIIFTSYAITRFVTINLYQATTGLGY